MSLSPNYIKRVIGEFIRIGVMVVLLFLIAGRLDYWQGWLFAGLSFWLPVFTLLWSLTNPKMADLLQERMKPAKPSQGGDKALVGMMVLGYLGVLVVGALDSGRFQWTQGLPALAYLLGTIASVVSASVMLWAMVVNRFFSTVVRIQIDRGHKVCREGPYRFVRHPAYLAMILGATSMPLVLGSLWAYIPAGVMVLVLVIRTVREDRTLQKELPGYQDYSNQVRYRLAPYIW